MTHDCPDCDQSFESMHRLHDHVNGEHDLVDRALEHGAADESATPWLLLAAAFVVGLTMHKIAVRTLGVER